MQKTSHFICLMILAIGVMLIDPVSIFAQRGGDHGDDRGGYGGRPSFGGGPPGGGFGGGPPGGGFGGGPPGGGFGGGPPGGYSRGGSDRGGSDRMTEMLAASDANHDGKLDLHEVPEYRRPFVKMMMDRAGIDSSKPVKIEDIKKKMEERSRGESGGDSKSSDKKTSEEPLVPGFGESMDFGDAPVSFGVRVAEVSNPYMPGGGGSSSAKSEEDKRMEDMAKGIIGRYDRNKNGVIDRDETEGMRSDPKEMDKNRDGRIDLKEMIERMKGYQQQRNGGGDNQGGGSQSNPADRYASYSRFKTQYELLPEGTPDWFKGLDQNKDGQVSMAEYSSNWTDSLVEEYHWWDINTDGVITPEECIAAKKESDEAGYNVHHPEPPPGSDGSPPSGSPPAPQPQGDGDHNDQPASPAPPQPEQHSSGDNHSSQGGGGGYGGDRGGSYGGGYSGRGGGSYGGRGR